MEEPEGSSKRRKILDSAQDPGIYTAPTQEGFQIEQINEGGFRIVRIRNKNNTLPNTKDYPTAERTGTPQQTKGTKRSRDQITTTDSRGGWPSVEATTQPLRQSIVELPNEENMVAIGRFRQALKRELKKRSTVIQKVLTKRMDKVKNRMRELEQENKELQQLASNLRNTLHDAIQQQKQKTDQMVSCGTQVDSALENNLIVSRGTQVNMRVVFKPVMPNNKDIVIPRVFNVPCFHHDGCAAGGKCRLVSLPPNSSSDEERLQQHSSEDLHEHIRKGRAFSPIPPSLVDSKIISATVESMFSRGTAAQKDEMPFSGSTDQMAEEVSTISSSPSLDAANTEETSAPNIPTERTTSGSLKLEAQLITCGNTNLSPKCLTSQHRTTMTTSGVQQAKEDEFYNHEGRQSTLPGSNLSSKAREFLDVNRAVNRPLSSGPPVVIPAVRKMANSHAQSEVTDVPTKMSSSEMNDHHKNYSQPQPLLLNTPSNIPSEQASGLHKQLLSQGSQLRKRPLGLLPRQDNDLRQRKTQQESQFMNTPTSPLAHQASDLQRQRLLQQLQSLNIPVDSGSQQQNARQESQFTNAPSSVQSRQERGMYKHTNAPPNTLYGQAPRGSNRRGSNRYSTSLSRPHRRIVPKTNSPNSLSRQELDISQKEIESRDFHSSVAPSTIPSSQLAPPSFQYRDESGVYEQSVSVESQLANIPSGPSTREGRSYRQSSPQQSQFSNTPSNLSYGCKHDLQRQNLSQESHLRNTPSILPCSQERRPHNGIPPVRSISLICSTADKPNSYLIAPSTPKSFGRDASLQTASSTFSSAFSKFNEPLQTPVPPKELSSEELRSLIVKQIVAEFSEEGKSQDAHPSKVPSSRIRSPHKTCQNRQIPVVPIQIMDTHSSSHQDSNSTSLFDLSTTNINYVGPRQDSSQDMPNLQWLNHKDHEKDQYHQNGARQQKQKLEFSNFPASSSFSTNPVTISRLSNPQRSGANRKRQHSLF